MIEAKYGKLNALLLDKSSLKSHLHSSILNFISYP
jgi:hypothetical protein